MLLISEWRTFSANFLRKLSNISGLSIVSAHIDASLLSIALSRSAGLDMTFMSFGTNSITSLSASSRMFSLVSLVLTVEYISSISSSLIRFSISACIDSISASLTCARTASYTSGDRSHRHCAPVAASVATTENGSPSAEGSLTSVLRSCGTAHPAARASALRGWNEPAAGSSPATGNDPAVRSSHARLSAEQSDRSPFLCMTPEHLSGFGMNASAMSLSSAKSVPRNLA